ncbi:hypothetical protein AcW1_003062 [Taiwanofungus camphoratus]|nr:hypothetical protein AcW1_003062 [Antrodia cinnamomea]
MRSRDTLTDDVLPVQKHLRVWVVFRQRNLERRTSKDDHEADFDIETYFKLACTRLAEHELYGMVSSSRISQYTRRLPIHPSHHINHRTFMTALCIMLSPRYSLSHMLESGFAACQQKPNACLQLLTTRTFGE